MQEQTGDDAHALREFRALRDDSERLEALLLSSRQATREATAAKDESRRTTEQLRIQNGRISKVERWQLGAAAVFLFIVAAGPFVFFALNTLGNK